MLFDLINAILAGLLGAPAVSAACSSNLIIDNFSKWSTNTNLLNTYTSGMTIILVPAVYKM